MIMMMMSMLMMTYVIPEGRGLWHGLCGHLVLCQRHVVVLSSQELQITKRHNHFRPLSTKLAHYWVQMDPIQWDHIIPNTMQWGLWVPLDLVSIRPLGKPCLWPVFGSKILDFLCKIMLFPYPEVTLGTFEFLAGSHSAARHFMSNRPKSSFLGTQLQNSSPSPSLDSLTIKQHCHSAQCSHYPSLCSCFMCYHLSL